MSQLTFERQRGQASISERPGVEGMIAAMHFDSPLVRVASSSLLAWVAASSISCGAGSKDDTRSGFHNVTVKWHLKNLDGTAMSACPAGFTTLVTHLYKIGYVEPPDALIVQPCTPDGSLTKPVATG
jgi:hypothetical protein